jgi:hypothetical protein
VATLITQNELLEALARANAAPAEARTVKELVALTGINEWTVRDAIGKLAMQDRIIVHQVPRPRIDGRVVIVVAILARRLAVPATDQGCQQQQAGCGEQ